MMPSTSSGRDLRHTWPFYTTVNSKQFLDHQDANCMASTPVTLSPCQQNGYYDDAKGVPKYINMLKEG